MTDAKPRSLTTLRADLRKAAAAGVGARSYRPHPSARGLPPLWTLPASPQAPTPAEGHNGGPPLERRRPGRPAKLSPELREAILDALACGVPVRAMATVPGFPHPATIRRWRAADPDFAAAFISARRWGWEGMAERVVEEVDEALALQGVRRARWVLSRRTHSLAQQAPAFFGGNGY